MPTTFLELLSVPITDENGNATPYFEDWCYQLIQSLGGEGSTITTDVEKSIESTARTPYIVGSIQRLEKRVEELESNLAINKIAHQVAQLLIDTSGLVAVTKNAAYTARNKDWVEVTKGAPITLPADPVINHFVRVSFADSISTKVQASNTDKIKIRGNLEQCVISQTAGNSFDFQYFGDYWRVA